MAYLTTQRCIAFWTGNTTPTGLAPKRLPAALDPPLTSEKQSRRGGVSDNL
jgi:hypothetical protein